MARRKIQTIAKAEREARIYWDAEWQEYRTTFYVSNVKQEDADHHTDDKEDAIDTATNWVNAA